MKKGIWVGCLIFVLTMIFLMADRSDSQSPPFKPEKSKITLGMSVSTATYLSVYLALDQGLFMKEGLSVEPLVFSGGSELVRGVVGGSIDIGSCSLASMSLGINAGQKIKIFYAGINPSPFYWHAVPKIKTIADSRGARFGVTRYGSNTDFLTRYALRVNGLDPEKDVKIVQGGASAVRLAAMDKGQLDVNIFASPDNFLAADKGYSLILSQKEFMKESCMQDFWATEKFIKENPNTIKAFLRAQVQGVRLAKKDRALSIKCLIERAGLQEKYAGRAYDEMIDFIYEDGRLPDEKSMDAFWEMGIMAGDYKEKWPREKYFDATFIETYSKWKP